MSSEFGDWLFRVVIPEMSELTSLMFDVPRTTLTCQCAADSLPVRRARLEL